MLEQLEQHLQQLQLYCRHSSNHLLAGHYHSAFKGQGIEFDEVRPYALGDDVRTIDWNVTARTGDLHIKRFHEERELNLIFVVDNSPSFACSTSEISRQYVAAQFSGLLGSAALANNDRLGLLSFSEGINDYLAPARGRSQLTRCLSKVLQPPKNGRFTSIKTALDHISQLRLKRSIVIVISDFFDQNDPATSDYSESLAILNSQHQLLAIALDDPSELRLGKSGLIEVKDVESQQHQWVDLANKERRQQFQQNMQQRLKQRTDNFANAGVDLLCHELGNDPITALLAYFQTRSLRITGETGG